MTLLQEFHDLMKGLRKETPEQLHGFMDLMNSAKAEGELSSKGKNIILVALSVANQCDWCIAIHVANAVKTGATRGEVMEAAWLAVLMGGNRRRPLPIHKPTPPTPLHAPARRRHPPAPPDISACGLPARKNPGQTRRQHTPLP